jgi:hypothetical protein
MTIDKVKNFIKTGRRGNRIIYHYGNLQFDRQDSTNKHGADIHAIANLVYASYKAKRVHLTQKRVSDGCAYIATIA